MAQRRDVLISYNSFYPTARFINNSNGEPIAVTYTRILEDNEPDLDSRNWTECMTCLKDAALFFARNFGQHQRFSLGVNSKLMKVELDEDGNENYRVIDAQFNASCRIVNFMDELPNAIDEAVRQIEHTLETYEDLGSGWGFLEINNMHVFLSEYRARRFGSYHRHTLPDFLQEKSKSIICIDEDCAMGVNQCFKYAVLAKLHPARTNRQRVSQYRPFENNYRWPSHWPVSIHDVEIFCKRNTSVGINVIEWSDERKAFFPLRCEKRVIEPAKMVDLLVYRNHFYCILRWNSLLRPPNTRNTSGKVCKNCLNSFTSDYRFERHVRCCMMHMEARVEMPTKENAFVKFSDESKTIQSPMLLFMDTEAVLSDECEDRRNAVQKHVLSSYALALVDTTKMTVMKKVLYRGEDAGIKLMASLREMIDLYRSSLPHVPLVMKPEDWTLYHQTKSCKFCGLTFRKSKEKVRHHHHATGKRNRSFSFHRISFLINSYVLHFTFI